MTTTAPRDPSPDGPRVPEGPGGTDLDAALARLQAWRAGESRPPATGAAPFPPVPAWPVHDGSPEGGSDVGSDVGSDGVPDDDLSARLTARRSARHVAAAYAAAHGHPLAGSEAGESSPGRRRWGLGVRTAVVASVAVLLLGIVASALALARPDDVTTLASLEADADTGAVGVGSSEAAIAGGEPSAGASDDASRADPSAGPDGAAVVVHVVGAVGEPGLVTVPAGARVADAIEAAGGATKEADTAALNLARAVTDGEQIVVPRPGDEVPSQPVDVGGTGTASGAAAEGGAGDGGAVVDLNAASATELDALPGIGPVLAERIVAWRTDHGPFADVEELDEVSGIGPAVLERLRDLVRV